eukprot:TRINITY_DN9244_c0_g1_i1.p1 TRINITY_DN9244_c0_g1~~TRINITY_DN9244_c0_g1_i1.p1  ORF type:complete len:138 (+),score=32.45 TRINITY_DN9244_c0_g1_i1:113-526(+)
MTTCDIPDEIAAAFKKFKLSRNTHRAFIMKINQEKLCVEVDKIVENVTNLQEFAEDHLPESVPRFVAYSTAFKTKDGRDTFPLVFFFFCPPSDIVSNSLYASTKTRLVNVLQIMKIYDVRDVEEFTDEWLLENLRKS